MNVTYVVIGYGPVINADVVARVDRPGTIEPIELQLVDDGTGLSFNTLSRDFTTDVSRCYKTRAEKVTVHYLRSFCILFRIAL